MAIANEYLDEIRKETDFERAVPIAKMRVAFRDQPGGYARFLNEGRIELAKRHGIESLDALVFIDLTLEEEARLYRRFGDYLKQTALDKYIAAQTEGHKDTVVIDRLLDEVGLHVTRSGGPEGGGLQAVAAVQKVLAEHGPQVLRDTLKILHDAFGLNMRGFSSLAIVGTAQFVIRYLKDPMYQRDKLIREMREQGISGMIRKRHEIAAAEGTTLGNPWGKAMLFYHNEGLKTRKLPPWQKVVVTEASLPQRREQMAKAKLVSDNKRRRDLAARAKKTVGCPDCRAEPGADCLRVDRTSLNAEVHNGRYAALRKFEAAARHQQRKAS